MERLVVKSKAGSLYYNDTEQGVKLEPHEITPHQRRLLLERLHVYEDTGLTPPEIVELKERDTAKAPEEYDGHWYKILEEIDETIERYGENPYIDGKVTDICYGLNIAKDIIHKHMNDGWISVEERLPEENGDDGELIVTDKDGRIWSGIYYGITEETDEYPCFHKWDEEMWYCHKPDVIAWRPLPEPYHPESEKEKPDWRQDMLRKFDRRSRQ